MVHLTIEAPCGMRYTEDALLQELREVEKLFGKNALSSLLSSIRGLVQYNLTHPNIPDLSPRLSECLYWASVGKTSEETGEIIRVSRATVTYHMKQAMAQLGTPTKTGAVAKAIRSGLI